MPNCRRAHTPGGTFFSPWSPFAASSCRSCQHPEHPPGNGFDWPSLTPFFPSTPVLPDHLHCVWTLPPGDGDFSLRWNLIKSAFAKGAKPCFHVDHWLNESRRKHRESTLWQRHFREHQIRNDLEYLIYTEYIHSNPVKHGWGQRVAD